MDKAGGGGLMRRRGGGGGARLACGIGVAALHILEGTAAVDDEVLSPSAEVHQVQGAEEECLYNKVPVTDCVHGVGAHSTIEAQLFCNELPVHTKGVACQSTCTTHDI